MFAVCWLHEYCKHQTKINPNTDFLRWQLDIIEVSDIQAVFAVTGIENHGVHNAWVLMQEYFVFFSEGDTELCCCAGVGGDHKHNPILRKSVLQPGFSCFWRSPSVPSPADISRRDSHRKTFGRSNHYKIWYSQDSQSRLHWWTSNGLGPAPGANWGEKLSCSRQKWFNREFYSKDWNAAELTTSYRKWFSPRHVSPATWRI